MRLLDGNALAERLLGELRVAIAAAPAGLPPPHVALVRVGDDPASVSYVRKKERTAASIGVEGRVHLLPEDASPEMLGATLDRLAADPRVHGILLQSPLPGALRALETEFLNRIPAAKDVDGFTRENLGRLVQDDPRAFVACTPAGLAELVRLAEVPTAGAHVVVVGRSVIVGKPAALLFLRRGLGGDATVTVAHSRTRDLAAITRQADILIAAVGQPHLIGADHVRPGAVVLDVGMNRIPDPASPRGYRLVGDVDFAAVAPRCAAITPVPGGVGPMTVALLMRNTVEAWRRATGQT